MIGKTVLAVLVPLLLLCASIGVVVAAYLWLFWYVSLHHTPLQRQLEDNGKPPEQKGLSEADLRQMPTIEYRKEEDGEERTPGGGEDECAVCLEPFQIGDLCRVIPACSHAFHVRCVDAWLCKRPVCPICRGSARVSEREEEKVVIVINVNVNGGSAQKEEARDEESGRSPPSATVESVVVDLNT